MSPIREPAVAGRFYPSSRHQCQQMLDNFLAGVGHESAAGRVTAGRADSGVPAGGVTAIGAIVPHAGWIYSGATAAKAMPALSAFAPQTVIIFGAVHVRTRHLASLYARGAWHTPLGDAAIDEELAGCLVDGPRVVVDHAVHNEEHSIEVLVPFIQRVLPDAMILPIMVQSQPEAADIGRQCATAVREIGRRVAYVGSTDLTHYGPAFGFEPHGRGEPGIRWAKEVNDRRFVRLIQMLCASEVVEEAVKNRNACGAGAVAAAIAAAVELKTAGYIELAHTTSAECEIADGFRPVNSVGYEAGVFLSG